MIHLTCTLESSFAYDEVLFLFPTCLDRHHPIVAYLYACIVGKRQGLEAVARVNAGHMNNRSKDTRTLSNQVAATIFSGSSCLARSRYNSASRNVRLLMCSLVPSTGWARKRQIKPAYI
jgi:hypothetical protein